MSLINDALKRAGQALKQNPNAASPAAGLQPVENSGNHGGGLVKPLLLLLAVVVLGGGGWFLWKAFKPGAKAQPAATTAKGTNVAAAKKATGPTGATNTAKATGKAKGATNQVAKTTATGAMASAKSPPAATTSAPPQVAVSKAATPPAADTAATAKAEPAAATWPPLRLHAVFYRLQNPSVRINRKTLYVGDEIDGVKVVAIDRSSAKLEFGGETRVMSLGKEE